jgi:hypothetical protein
MKTLLTLLAVFCIYLALGTSAKADMDGKWSLLAEGGQAGVSGSSQDSRDPILPCASLSLQVPSRWIYGASYCEADPKKPITVYDGNSSAPTARNLMGFRLTVAELGYAWPFMVNPDIERRTYIPGAQSRTRNVYHVPAEFLLAALYGKANFTENGVQKNPDVWGFKLGAGFSVTDSWSFLATLRGMQISPDKNSPQMTVWSFALGAGFTF